MVPARLDSVTPGCIQTWALTPLSSRRSHALWGKTSTTTWPSPRVCTEPRRSRGVPLSATPPSVSMSRLIPNRRAHGPDVHSSPASGECGSSPLASHAARTQRAASAEVLCARPRRCSIFAAMGSRAHSSLHGRRRRWSIWGPGELTLVRGPRDERLPEHAWASIRDRAWTVSPQSNRVAVRLSGPALPISTDPLPPEPLVRGAVQVPPDGQPIIFLADHPVTGGYPVIGVLTPAACDAVAQCRPGTSVRLGAVS